MLSDVFGYPAFRPMQQEVIQSVLDGRDTLVIMPTGGGKSLCFQVPALVMDGVCVVVSPLIALMKDQVEALRANGVGAAFLNSSLSGSEQLAVEQQVLSGEIKLLYVSPEKLVTESFTRLLGSVSPSLFAVDEAHCISEWGHDFRPEYTQLQVLKQQFPGVPVAAFTATADKLTRKDISGQLGMHQPAEFVASFDRPNLSLRVAGGQKRLQAILRFLRDRQQQSGIVYCLSRKSTETLAEKLRQNGYNAAAYHAGLSADVRSRTQEDFINDRVPIICATIAFGMGIDKPNVRFVIHYNLPKNIEGYYQEIGRGGRDGLPADTLLFYSYADVIQLTNMFEESANAAVQRAKLERMQQYAEALICRRKILLHYFGEHRAKNCGNCDVCKNPPEYFDGTRHVQMALSAVKRTNQQVPMGTLIKILIGSSQAEVIEPGWHTIKTYGVGKSTPFHIWQQYVQQMLHFGLLEVAYDDANRLRITQAGEDVLFGRTQAQLVVPQLDKGRGGARKAEPKKVSAREQLETDLFERLRTLRKEIAAKQGVPPYIVFGDVSLREMAAEQPQTEGEMLGISGVGNHKLEKYGAQFLACIRTFVAEQASKGKRVKGGSQLQTLELLSQGFTVEQIATERQLNPNTILSHVGDLYENGHEIDMLQFVPQAEIDAVATALTKLGGDVSLSGIHDALNGEVDYARIRLALAYLSRNAPASGKLF